MSELDIVALLGTGPESCALARLASSAGLSVRLLGADAQATRRARQELRDAIEADLAQGRITGVERQRTFDGLLATQDLEEAVTHAGLVLLPGATSARPQALLGRLGEACRASTVIGLAQLDDALPAFPQPGRLLGFRFPVGPGSAGRHVEVTAGPATARHAVDRACAFALRLGREPRVTVAPDGADRNAA